MTVRTGMYRQHRRRIAPAEHQRLHAGEEEAEQADEGIGEGGGEEPEQPDEDAQLPWLRDRPSLASKDAPLPQALAQRLHLDPSQLYSLHSSLFGAQSGQEGARTAAAQRSPQQAFGSPGLARPAARTLDPQQQQPILQRSPEASLGPWASAQPQPADAPDGGRGAGRSGAWADAEPAITACSGVLGVGDLVVRMLQDSAARAVSGPTAMRVAFIRDKALAATCGVSHVW